MATIPLVGLCGHDALAIGPNTQSPCSIALLLVTAEVLVATIFVSWSVLTTTEGTQSVLGSVLRIRPNIILRFGRVLQSSTDRPLQHPVFITDHIRRDAYHLHDRALLQALRRQLRFDLRGHRCRIRGKESFLGGLCIWGIFALQDNNVVDEDVVFDKPPCTSAQRWRCHKAPCSNADLHIMSSDGATRLQCQGRGYGSGQCELEAVVARERPRIGCMQNERPRHTITGRV
mmetsp:Transcript_138919/g.361041  ORF Transcript_138919/g.361041 Transcript_138919/m.361041 type:complete len:231 (+) Transcript_138919:187-879(+)